MLHVYLGQELSIKLRVFITWNTPPPSSTHIHPTCFEKLLEKIVQKKKPRPPPPPSLKDLKSTHVVVYLNLHIWLYILIYTCGCIS
jgi:hypothetical protein